MRNIRSSYSKLGYRRVSRSERSAVSDYVGAGLYQAAID